jgi:TIR domain
MKRGRPGVPGAHQEKVVDGVFASAAERPDVFLCYAWEDKQQADALRLALEAVGLVVFQDEPGMRDFDYIPERIDAALRDSRVLIALYTPAFPASEYCRQELHFALLRSYYLHRRRTRVLAVVQRVDIAEVRPGRLKYWRLPGGSQPLGTTVAEIADYVRRLSGEDPRRLGEAPDPPKARWYPGPLRDVLELIRAGAGLVADP